MGSCPPKAPACAEPFRNSPPGQCLVSCQYRRHPNRTIGPRDETTRSSAGWARQTKEPSRLARAARAVPRAPIPDRAGPRIPAMNQRARRARRAQRRRLAPHQPREEARYAPENGIADGPSSRDQRWASRASRLDGIPGQKRSCPKGRVLMRFASRLDFRRK